MRKKLIAFDMDGTLAPSKSPLPDRMAAALNRLLEKYQVCVISGGKFELFQRQLVNNLEADPAKLERLHLMPTCGTRYYRYDPIKSEWVQIYAEDFEEHEKDKIKKALLQAVREQHLEEPKVYGEVLEDRGSQVTWSALGQEIVAELGEEGVRLKEEWDADNSKKNRLRDRVAELLPEFEVRVGGVTSIDVTKPGIDKAYGMRKLMEMLELGMDDILYIGDRIEEGGNDYPVKVMGIETMQINYWHETALAVEAIVNVTD